MVAANTSMRGVDRIHQLPRAIYAALATHPVGCLNERLVAIQRLRSSLLAGAWPKTELPWPPSRIQDAIRNWITRAGLPRWCRENVSITDRLILDILEGIEAYDASRRQRLLIVLDEGAEAADGDPMRDEWLETFSDLLVVYIRFSPHGIAGMIEQWIEQLELELLAHDLAPVDAALSLLAAAWEGRIRIWDRLESLLGPLGKGLGLGWDLSAGVLAHKGWQHVAQLQDVLNRLPSISELVRELGRLRQTDELDAESLFPDLFAALKRIEEERREIEHPLARHQAKGIERSGDFTRMLPSEAMLLLHPQLKLLWHAKRIERALLTYRVRGTYITRATHETDEPQPKAYRRERGPIIFCLDTSGSMQGAPELIAKALVLEACRIARDEDRRCFLYSFSGPNECKGRELSLTPDGLGLLLDFLCLSFNGGTHIDRPFLDAITMINAEGWSRADILLVTDGDFPEPSAPVQAIIDDARKRLKLRIAGLLVGRSPNAVVSSLCNPLKEISGWSR